MKLSIIIHAYNEEKTVAIVVDKFLNLELKGLDKEVLVVNDGSSDNTKGVLKRFEELPLVKVIHHEHNKGKGAAVQTGIKNSSGDLIMIQDADLEYNVDEIPGLVQALLEKKADVVYDSRFLGANKNKGRYWLYYFGNIALNKITNALYFSKITDLETGHKLFKADIIKNIPLHARGFEFEPEITAKILKRKAMLVEVPISYKCRAFEEGKKISWKDGIKAIWFLTKYRFTD